STLPKLYGPTLIPRSSRRRYGSMVRERGGLGETRMKIELELDEGIYQAIKRMAPGIDIEMVLSELVRGTVIIMATHQEEFMRAYLEGSKEDKGILDEHLRKLVPKVIEKATLGVYECDDCHQQFTLPQEDFGEVTCPSCGKKWTKEDLPKIEMTGQRRFGGD
ncbi:unnamed protein product, partial [marine sediment metagenome]